MVNNNRNFIERNPIWKFDCFCESNRSKRKYNNFIDLLEKSSMDWTIAYYSDLIAFKNPANRTTYIYEKEYFINRIEGSGDSSILNCKSIKF